MSSDARAPPDPPMITAGAMSSWRSNPANVSACIADSEPYQTGFQAVKLGSWLFLMPFLFLYTGILLTGPMDEIIRCIFTALCALTAWAAAVQGYMLVKVRPWERGMLFLAAFGLLHAGWVTDVIGVALLVIVFMTQRRAQKGLQAA